MAQIPNLEPRLGVVWKTKRPNHDRPNRSSSFSLQDSEWNIQINFTSSSMYLWDYYAISLQRGNNEAPLKNKFHVTTLLESQKSKKQPYVCSVTTVKSTQHVLWEFHGNQIVQNIPEFEKGEDFKIICLFHGTSPKVLLPSDETAHLSTQTDFDHTLRPALNLNGQPNGQSSADVSVQPSLDFPTDLENLSQDFNKLLEDEVFPDVKLKCGDRTVFAHRPVLAARSKIFTSMFENNMAEKATGVVDLKDVDPTVLDLFIKYVYSGKVEGLSEGIVPSLYAVGDKYAVHALKKACSDWMIESLTEENCLSFLILADGHRDELFKDTVVSYVVKHLGVIGRESWTRFNDEQPRLSVAVYQKTFAGTLSRQMPRAEE